MKNQNASNVVSLFKYVETNQTLSEKLIAVTNEGIASLTKATEPVVGAVVVIYGRDSVKVLRLGETPDLQDFVGEIEFAYPAEQDNIAQEG